MIEFYVAISISVAFGAMFFCGLAASYEDRKGARYSLLAILAAPLWPIALVVAFPLFVCWAFGGDDDD